MPSRNAAQSEEEQLLQYLSHEQVEELRQLFMEQARTMLSELLAARAQWVHDSTQDKPLRAIAHTLKGSGASFGFGRVTQAADRVEGAAPADLARELKELIVQLELVLRDEASR